jgi:membrane peptidoglycan carboxypeptidase
MTDILKGVIVRGTGRGADLGRPLAGKTGTTDDYRNAWFIGYTPEMVTGVWVGNDDNTPTEKVVGATVPTRIWRAFMETALAAVPATDWEVPPRVIVVTTCGASGLLAMASCDDPRPEAFIRGTEPTEYLLSESTEVRMNRQWTRDVGGAGAGRVADPGDEGSAGENGGAGEGGGAVQTRRFPLSVTAPADGQTVSAPFAVEGSTVPGARVEIAITVEAAESPPQHSTVFVGAMRDGRFRYTFWPPSPQAARYTITVTAYVRGGDPETATVIVVNPAPADGGTPHP